VTGSALLKSVEEVDLVSKDKPIKHYYFLTAGMDIVDVLTDEPPIVTHIKDGVEVSK